MLKMFEGWRQREAVDDTLFSTAVKSYDTGFIPI